MRTRTILIIIIGPATVTTDSLWPLHSSGGAMFLYAQSPHKHYGFQRFDSSMISTLRGGILRLIGDFLESLNHQILVAILLGNWA